MAVRFKADDHSYTSIDPTDSIEWLGVTTFVSQFKKPFDPVTQSAKSSKNKKSKWYGMDPLDIQRIWASEGNRANTLGHWYHTQRETDITSCESITREGVTLPIVKPVFIDGLKYAPEQKLTDGVYPEHMVYLKSAGICGQSDLVEVINGHVNITDYKTNKEIKMESYKNWEGISVKMLSPMDHLDDCNYYHYALQLSTYLYIILKHNPKLRPGKLMLHHITFEEAGKDDFGNPITALDHDGNFMVKSVAPIEVPYLRDEVRLMLEWLHNNRDKIRKK